MSQRTGIGVLLCNRLHGLQVVIDEALVRPNRGKDIATWVQRYGHYSSSMFGEAGQLFSAVKHLDCAS